LRGHIIEAADDAVSERSEESFQKWI